jgi:hypothetical protein
MNEETEQLQRQLERATAAGCEPDPSADAETAALRETWLALGQLLDAAAPVGDAMPEMRCPRRLAASRWSWAALAAVAVWLLIAAGVAWLPAWSVPGQAPVEVAARPSPLPSAAASAQTPAEAGLEWDDSLDEEIALAGQKILSIAQEPYRLRAIDSPIAERLKEMDRDLTESTL